MAEAAAIVRALRRAVHTDRTLTREAALRYMALHRIAPDMLDEGA